MLWTPEKTKIINLLEANESELANFRDQVQKRDGKIQILVHPYFEEDLPPHPYHPRIPGFLEKRDIFIQACLNNQVPLIIFEQTNNYHRLAIRLRGINAPVYTVKTHNDNPLPQGDTNSWEKLISILRNTGTRNIVVGGQLLFFYRNLLDLNKDDRMPTEISLSGGCVGTLARRLWLKDFQVTLSSISSPHKKILISY